MLKLAAILLTGSTLVAAIVVDESTMAAVLIGMLGGLAWLSKVALDVGRIRGICETEIRSIQTTVRDNSDTLHKLEGDVLQITTRCELINCPQKYDD